MSLEEALNKNTAAVQQQNELLAQLLSKTPGAAAAPASTEDKPKTTKATKATETKEEAPAAEGPTYESVKAKASAWLGEHPKGSEEQAARRAYLEEQLWPKLGIKKLGDLEGKPADLKKVDTWLDGKAKSDLLGYGVGIFAKPAEAAADEGGDEL